MSDPTWFKPTPEQLDGCLFSHICKWIGARDAYNISMMTARIIAHAKLDIMSVAKDQFTASVINASVNRLTMNIPPEEWHAVEYVGAYLNFLDEDEDEIDCIICRVNPAPWIDPNDGDLAPFHWTRAEYERALKTIGDPI